MSNNPRVVFWANRDEWTDIYQCLYSFNDVNLQRKGADRLSAWMSRSSGKIPLAIECTNDLILAHLADSVSFNPEVRLILSMALIRFVNGMVDMYQKGLYARSVHAIAQEIGIPDWLVDLRHEGTHEKLPSQQTLRAGVRVALSWLREEYWEAQMKLHKDSEEKLCEMLDSYQALCAKKKKKKSMEKQEQKVKDLAQEITNFVSTKNLWRYLQASLLNNGLQSEDQDLDSSTSDQALTASSQLPEAAINLWKPLLKALDKQSPDFIPFFLVSILDPQSNNLENNLPDHNHLMLLALWLLKSGSIFTAKLPWLTLLEIFLKNPNSLTREFVTFILKEMPSIPDSLKQNTLSLINIKFTEYLFEKCPDDVYECKSLQHMLNNKSVEQPVQGNNSCLSTGWSTSGGQTKWNLIPFGEILGCEYQSVNLLELPKLFVTQRQINNDNSIICSNVAEEDTEMINKYSENEVIDSMSTESDITCNDNHVIDKEVNGVAGRFNNEQLKAEICLF